MAMHDESRAPEKKSADDMPIFSAENLQANMKSIYYSRTFLSIIGGVVAGIWGFTGLTGFVFYFLVMAFTSLGLALKAKFSAHKYFDFWNRVIFDGFFSGLMVCLKNFAVLLFFFPYGSRKSFKSFVLFWTFAYDIVHIF